MEYHILMSNSWLDVLVIVPIVIDTKDVYDVVVAQSVVSVIIPPANLVKDRSVRHAEGLIVDIIEFSLERCSVVFNHTMISIEKFVSNIISSDITSHVPDGKLVDPNGLI